MSSPHGPMRLIANPRAGSGAVREVLPLLCDALRREGVDFDVVQTSGKAGAGEAAARSLAEGIRYLVAVGGDGTLHEVVNGMFDRGEPIAGEAVLGVCSAGSGGDFPRTFGLDRPPAIVARHLAGPHTMDIDVGLVTYRGADGAPATRLFVNVAQVGYGAEAVRAADRLPRWLGRLRYLLAAWAAIRAAPRQDTVITIARGRNTVPLVDLVVANGQFFGGGMKVAPRALPDDGRFNVLAFTGTRSQVFQLTPKLFQGEHLPHPDILEWQSPTVAVDAPTPMRIEADGELLGFTPAAFSLLDKALRIKL